MMFNILKYTKIFPLIAMQQENKHKYNNEIIEIPKMVKIKEIIQLH